MIHEAKSERKRVSIVIPFFNEGGAIAALPSAIWPILEKIPDIAFEVICVDDGSSDATLHQLIALSKVDERFRILELSRNFGKEAALTAGLDAARGDAVIPMDADLQDPPALEQMIAAWRAGAEVVLARRKDRSSDSVLKRKTAAWSATGLLRRHMALSR